MPINELESHPFLQIGESIDSSKMIIGTFPIFSLTVPRIPRKLFLQAERGDISFFYGSRSNYFWSWYQKYIDENVDILDAQSLTSSLRNNGIAISDLILECNRIDESFFDNKLKNIKWNLKLAEIIQNKVKKIVCTSKSDSGALGWLRDKILIPSGFTLNQIESATLHKQILEEISQSNLNIKLIAQVLVKDSKKISIVALPSPGSPFRSLRHFGRVKNLHESETYLDAYLSSTFKWFTS